MPWVPQEIPLSWPVQVNGAGSWPKPCRPPWSSRLLRENPRDMGQRYVCLPGLPDNFFKGNCWAPVVAPRFLGFKLQCDSAVCRLLLQTFGGLSQCWALRSDVILKVFWKEVSPNQICHWNHGSMKRLAGALKITPCWPPRLRPDLSFTRGFHDKAGKNMCSVVDLPCHGDHDEPGLSDLQSSRASWGTAWTRDHAVHHAGHPCHFSWWHFCPLIRLMLLHAEKLSKTQTFSRMMGAIWSW